MKADIETEKHEINELQIEVDAEQHRRLKFDERQLVAVRFRKITCYTQYAIKTTKDIENKVHVAQILGPTLFELAGALEDLQNKEHDFEAELERFCMENGPLQAGVRVGEGRRLEPIKNFKRIRVITCHATNLAQKLGIIAGGANMDQECLEVTPKIQFLCNLLSDMKADVKEEENVLGALLALTDGKNRQLKAEHRRPALVNLQNIMRSTLYASQTAKEVENMIHSPILVKLICVLDDLQIQETYFKILLLASYEEFEKIDADVDALKGRNLLTREPKLNFSRIQGYMREAIDLAEKLHIAATSTDQSCIEVQPKTRFISDLLNSMNADVAAEEHLLEQMHHA